MAQGPLGGTRRRGRARGEIGGAGESRPLPPASPGVRGPRGSERARAVRWPPGRTCARPAVSLGRRRMKGEAGRNAELPLRSPAFKGP